MLALAGFFSLIALVFGLRLVALSSDPYRNLDWSSGLLTDEGFYLHNARNSVLFGNPRTDDFNNSLLSPTLNALQTAVFRIFGTGMIQARLISVSAGLLTLPLFFAALRRAYSTRVAAFAAVFLGLDHVPLLYSRMALMDTPAALILTAAFYCWVRARRERAPGADGGRLDRHSRLERVAPLLWLFLCGASLGLAFATRGLCAFAIPGPLLLLFRIKRGDPPAFHRLLAFAFGLAIVLTLYAAFWMLPHRMELAQTNGFYLHQQLLPRSFGHFLRIVTRAFFGDTRGLAPAFIRHTPILFALAIAGMCWRFSVRRSAEPLSENTLYLGGWLVSGLITFGAIGYSPSRYYILFFPALAALAALTLEYVPEVAPFLLLSKWKRAIFGGFLAYHLFLFTRPVNGLPGNLFIAALTLCAVLILLKLKPNIQRPLPGARRLVLLWALINALWLGDWLGHLAYTQENAGRWLTAHLPPDAVLIGDVAPGISVNTNFVSVPVIPGLCNDNQPIERFAGWPRVIIILDGNRREAWWDKQYPALVTPSRRILYLRDAVGFPVGIYLVPPKNTKSQPETKKIIYKYPAGQESSVFRANKGAEGRTMPLSCRE